MREETFMEIEWRTIQFILDNDGVHEVEVDYADSTNVRCSCKNFTKILKCKHSKYVRNMIIENDGQYSIHIPVDVTDDAATNAMGSKESFRDFIVKYGKVEVID